MISKPAVTGLLALLAVTFACGRERTAQASELQNTDDAVLTVQNDYLNDVAVYAVRAGTKTRCLASRPGTMTRLPSRTR